MALNQIQRIVDERKGAQGKKVDLNQVDLFDVVLVVLRDDSTGGGCPL